MPKPTIIILGGGISGLTLAYTLLPYMHLFNLHLIEKEETVGGWMRTDHSTGFFFEKGPRVFRKDRSHHLLSLIHQLGLSEEVIPVSSQGRKRYVWNGGRLKKMPQLSWSLIKGIFRDLREPPSCGQDESVWDFACRRFNAEVAREVFDPVVTGIYGGDSKHLSFQSCFPLYARLERKYGSLIKGMIKERSSFNADLFGLKRGTESLINQLKMKLTSYLHLQEEVLAITEIGDQFEIKTSQGVYIADHLFSALPPQVIGKLLIPELCQIALKGVVAVHLGYHKKILHQEGFGYLTRMSSQEEAMGVIFDSNAFLEHNRTEEETRLTVKLKDETLSDEEAVASALRVIHKHLKIKATPDKILITRAEGVFPQLHVGYSTWIQEVLHLMQQRSPYCTLSGNYLEGVSVNDCIAYSQKMALQYLQKKGIVCSTP
ncbi:MAG: protoporphyrinogen oxidase [Candidatus Rhabdochlamydia sp.]